MVSLSIGMVCVVVVTLLLLGSSIVEPKLIHYYDVGVVCAVCLLALCVLYSCVLRVVGDGCVIDQVVCSVDPPAMYIVEFIVLRIAVGFFVFIRGVCCACRIASVIVSVVLIMYVASVAVVLCFRCAFESVFVKRVFICITS